MKLELVMLTTVISLFGGVNANNNRFSAVLYRPGEINNDSPRLFLVTCTNNCKVVSAKSFGGSGGRLILSVRRHKTHGFLCREYQNSGPNQECSGYKGQIWQLGKKYFYVKLESYYGGIGKDVSVSVTLEGSVPTIVEVIKPTAAVQKDKSGNVYVEVKSGSMPIKGANFQHFKIECSDNCKGIGFSSSGGKGDVKLFGREEEFAFIHQNACTNNCICESNDPGNSDVCKLPDGKRKFDLSSKIFWIHLDPNPSFENVIAKVTGDNIVKVSQIDITKNFVKLSDGSFVLAIGPTKKGGYTHMYAQADPKLYVPPKFKNVRFELIGAGQGDIEVRAGYSTKVNANGVCTKCDCQGLCNKPFDATDYDLPITFTMLKDVKGTVYVKLFGEHIFGLLHMISAYGSYIIG